MPKNLEEKISLLLDDIERMPKSDSIRKVKQFVLKELDFTKVDYQINETDLLLIKSMASKMIMHENFRGTKLEARDIVSAHCYAHAVMLFLRSKDLVGFSLLYDKAERK